LHIFNKNVFPFANSKLRYTWKLSNLRTEVKNIGIWFNKLKYDIPKAKVEEISPKTGRLDIIFPRGVAPVSVLFSAQVFMM